MPSNDSIKSLSMSNLTMTMNFLILVYLIMIKLKTVIECLEESDLIFADFRERTNVTNITITSAKEWPNVVVLTQDSFYICNGILISQEWILTLSTCILPYLNLSILQTEKMWKYYDGFSQRWRLQVDTNNAILLKNIQISKLDYYINQDYLSLVKIESNYTKEKINDIVIPDRVPKFAVRKCKVFVWLNNINQRLSVNDGNGSIEWGMHQIQTEISWFDDCALIMVTLKVDLSYLKNNLCSVIKKNEFRLKETVIGKIHQSLYRFCVRGLLKIH